MVGIRIRAEEREAHMGKHAADKQRAPQAGGRIRHFTDIERQERPRPQAKELQRRPKGDRDDGLRAQQFARIERGREA